MLPPVHRLRQSGLFRQATRHGRKSGSRTMVVHLAELPGLVEPQIGFVVSKAVGNAVTRNTVKRRLRHLAREQVELLPGSAVLVVRALPAAAAASTQTLSADLDRCLERVLS